MTATLRNSLKDTMSKSINTKIKSTGHHRFSVTKKNPLQLSLPSKHKRFMNKVEKLIKMFDDHQAKTNPPLQRKEKKTLHVSTTAAGLEFLNIQDHKQKDGKDNNDEDSMEIEDDLEEEKQVESKQDGQPMFLDRLDIKSEKEDFNNRVQTGDDEVIIQEDSPVNSIPLVLHSNSSTE